MTLDSISDEEYNLVYTSNGVHVWISDLSKMYGSFRRVLKPDGRYIMFETHPFIRPFDANGSEIKIKKPYTSTGPFVSSVTEYGWRIRDWFDPNDTESFDPIPIKRFNEKTLMTDGHTRAVAAHLAGYDSVPVYWDEDELDMRVYAMDINWCDEEGIHSPIDLAGRIVPHKDYERLWRKRCMEMIL